MEKYLGQSNSCYQADITRHLSAVSLRTTTTLKQNKMARCSPTISELYIAENNSQLKDIYRYKEDHPGCRHSKNYSGDTKSFSQDS